jgi:hypothetical protein
MKKYRIDHAYHSVYEFDEYEDAYLFCGKTSNFTKEQLKQMENEEV